MKTKLLITALVLGLASTTTATAADNWTAGGGNAALSIYSWQNWSYDISEVEDSTAITGSDRDQQRIRNNAANIGFRGSIDTGLAVGGQAVKANFQCEQFMFPGFGGSLAPQSDWCNRNSKISLSGAWGEFMWGNWLTPYNEMVAGWIDPYWDADFTSHTALMGTINSGDYAGPGQNPSAGAGSLVTNGFNKRQGSLTQYFSPNFNGFTFRAATSTGDQGDTEVMDSNGNAEKLDPRLWEAGIAWTRDLANGDNLWLAATYSNHDEWAAVDFNCSDSDDTGYRFAGRYIHQWAGGGSTAISAMWENIEYEWDDCAGPGGAGGIASFVSTGIAGAPNLDLDKDTWMVSFTHAFGNGWDIRGTYLDADEFDCSVSDGCSTDNDTDATSWNLGIGYNTPGGTLLAIKYAEVDNEDNSRYDTGFYNSGVNGNGQDVQVIGFSITQGF